MQRRGGQGSGRLCGLAGPQSFLAHCELGVRLSEAMSQATACGPVLGAPGCRSCSAVLSRPAALCRLLSSSQGGQESRSTQNLHAATHRAPPRPRWASAGSWTPGPDRLPSISAVSADSCFGPWHSGWALRSLGPQGWRGGCWVCSGAPISSVLSLGSTDTGPGKAPPAVTELVAPSSMSPSSVSG